jgi:Domain of unknown function (DUF4326)
MRGVRGRPLSKRIQRRRTKGWRMPEGAVYVGRPSRWGNPFRKFSALGNVSLYSQWARSQCRFWPDFLEPLRGHDLVCWCPLSAPCHADVLLELLA